MGALTLQPLPYSPSLVVLLSVSPSSLPFPFSFLPIWCLVSSPSGDTWVAGLPLNNCVFRFWHGCTKNRHTQIDTHTNTHTHKNNMLQDSRLAFPRCRFLQSAMWTARLNVRERYLIPRAHTHAYRHAQKPNRDKTPSTDSVWSMRLNVKGWCKFTWLLPEVVHHNANAGRSGVLLSSKNFTEPDSGASAGAADNVCVDVRVCVGDDKEGGPLKNKTHCLS